MFIPTKLTAAGLLDELLSTIKFIYDNGRTIYQKFKDGDFNDIVYNTQIIFNPGLGIGLIIVQATFSEVYRNKLALNFKTYKTTLENLGITVSKIFNTAKQLTYEQLTQIGVKTYEAFTCWLGEYIEGGTIVGDIGYEIGKIGFQVIVGISSGGAAVPLKGSQMGVEFFKIIESMGDIEKWFKMISTKLINAPKYQKFKCWLLRNGCFVKDTPVLMAGNTIGNSGKVYAMAAMMPFVGVPVDDTPLLGYALANKTVNSSYHLTASSNDDVYTGLMNGDPYTSAEQKQRDLYEINDKDWHSVSFEGVYSTSVCHIAMHQDWITQHGYVVDGIVNMNLPEQGISGPFRITSIKHILPQKKPESDPGDVYPVNPINGDYEWKPVTGLFIHHSDQVHNISFDNNEVLGVTAPHPIFSTTHNDWRLAGELEVGEKVLTYYGEATVTKTEKKGGSEAVYNLEVKDLHNFLVGNVGAVVHNTCITAKICSWMWTKPLKYADGTIESCLDHVKKGHMYNPTSKRSQFGSHIKNEDDLEEVFDNAMKEFRKNDPNTSEFLPDAYPQNPNIPDRKHQIVIDLKDYPHLLDSDGNIGTYINHKGVKTKTSKILVSIDNDGRMWNCFPTIKLN